MGIMDDLRDNMKRYPSASPNSFFELIRADFMLDETGNPFLLEINSSPNLHPKSFHEGTDEMMKRGTF